MNELTFAQRIKNKEAELTAGMSTAQLVALDHLELNKEAIKLVQADLATFAPLEVATLLEETKHGHGFWLTNHQELIEDQVASLIKIHGYKTALALINDNTSQAHKSIYKTIEHIREALYQAEQNANHVDDYFNAGGFFGHWGQLTQDEKLTYIGNALEAK